MTKEATALHANKNRKRATGRSCLSESAPLPSRSLHLFACHGNSEALEATIKPVQERWLDSPQLRAAANCCTSTQEISELLFKYASSSSACVKAMPV